MSPHFSAAATVLKVSHQFAAGDVRDEMAHVLGDMITEKTKGEIRFRYYPAGLLTGVVAVYAWPMWWEALVNREHSESLWGPPLWIPCLFLPLGMTLLFMQYIVYIRNKIVALRTGRSQDAADDGSRNTGPIGALETDGSDAEP